MQPVPIKTTSRYRFSAFNHMTFPSELRDAIPELPTCAGRVLLLDSTTGGHSLSRVSLRLQVRETGRLKGKYTVVMDLQPEAARHLADMLRQLADQAGPTHSRM